MKLICTNCEVEFERTKSQRHKSEKLNCKPFCSQKCLGKYRLTINYKDINCTHCNIQLRKRISTITNNNFCSQSCAGTYTNLHKTAGTKVSKLEKWMQSQLIKKYPNLDFIFNGKDIINSELDIYIPSLKLAFELNGIFHYEPIYGERKLNQIKNNDNRKFQACAENGISLCIIDTSGQKYFKIDSSMKYLKIIVDIIAEMQGIEPC